MTMNTLENCLYGNLRRFATLVITIAASYTLTLNGADAPPRSVYDGKQKKHDVSIAAREFTWLHTLTFEMGYGKADLPLAITKRLDVLAVRPSVFLASMLWSIEPYSDDPESHNYDRWRQRIVFYILEVLARKGTDESKEAISELERVIQPREGLKLLWDEIIRNNQPK